MMVVTSVHVADDRQVVKRWHSPSMRWIVILFIAGALVRVALLQRTADMGLQITDEQDYARLAHSLLRGNGFADETGRPTSSRPPLYPMVVAGAWWVLGTTDPQPIRIIQTLVTLMTAALVAVIGTRLYARSVGLWAAAAFWCYPTLVAFDVLLLTEVLFTALLMTSIWLLLALLNRPRVWMAIATGVAVGLAALTRSVLGLYPIVLAGFCVTCLRVPLIVRCRLGAAVLGGALLVLAPWAVRNYQVQRAFVLVDVLGGFNLRMGNYEHTLTHRMWDTLSLGGERHWAYDLHKEHPEGGLTEGQKAQWAQAKAIEYMVNHPGTTLHRAIIRFADFWGLEREVAAGFERGYFSPPRWFSVATVIAIGLTYPVCVLLAVMGVWLAPPADRTALAASLLPVGLVMSMHLLTFGHSRYHLPLIPVLLVFAAAAATAGPRRLLAKGGWPRVGALGTIAIFLAVWVQQLTSDVDRLRVLLEMVL
jgi:4-amino-4-deoxy-L-arabinose transferase-like glycosyltransferase